jgi:predicted NBD/HSP70 family sugar kinase
MNEARPIRARAGTNLGGASAHNRRVVLDALRRNGSLSRAEIARATRLTPQTVSNIVEELGRDGLVIPEAPVRLGRGQPATPYRLVPEGAFALGLQIDRHSTRVVAADLVGRAIARREAPLPAGGPDNGIPVVLGLVAEVRRALVAAVPAAERRLVGLGLAMPGPFGVTTPADDPWMMSAWQRYPLLETLAIGTGLEVELQNDASAAAIAERLAGAAHGLDSLVYIFLGYGLGAGIIIDGEIYSGAGRNAGEIGMLLTPLPSCGGSFPLDCVAPLEHVASLASLARAVGHDPGDPALFAAIAAVIERGDPRLEEWLDTAARHLRWAVQIVESLFDPQTVIFGGQAPAALFERLMARMLPLLPSVSDRPDRRLPRLVLGAADPWTVAIGAAAEPISRAFDPRFSAILKSRFGTA